MHSPKLPGPAPDEGANWINQWIADWGDTIARFVLSHTHDRQLAQNIAQETFWRIYQWHEHHPHQVVRGRRRADAPDTSGSGVLVAVLLPILIGCGNRRDGRIVFLNAALRLGFGLYCTFRSVTRTPRRIECMLKTHRRRRQDHRQLKWSTSWEIGV